MWSEYKIKKKLDFKKRGKGDCVLEGGGGGGGERGGERERGGGGGRASIGQTK